MADESNLDAVANDILDAMKDEAGNLDEDDEALVENFKEMVLAGMDDLRNEIADNEVIEANEKLTHQGKSLIVAYAAITVKVGQAAGLLDADGQPTDKMPAEIGGFLKGVTEQFRQWRALYIKTHGQEGWEAINGA